MDISIKGEFGCPRIERSIKMKKNNIHDKVFDCPKCTNKTLTPVEHDKILGIGHGDICICEECGAELKAVPHYDFTVDFEEIEDNE